MKTKTIIFGVIAMLAMAMFASSLVLAEENAMPILISENTNSAQSNVSDVSSGTIFWKEVGLWFTFNQEKKINREMELAQLRLQQAEYATSHNMTKVAEKALDSYRKLMNKIEKRNDLIGSKDSANANIVRLAAMDQAILVHQERITRLTSLLENANLTDEQKAKLSEQISKAENQTFHLQYVQSEKEDKIRTRLMAQGNLTESEAQAMIDSAKDNVTEIIGGAKNAWKNFKEDSKRVNMTPGQYMKEQRKTFGKEVKNGVSGNPSAKN